MRGPISRFWSRQPLGQHYVERSHPLARGLTRYFTFGQSGFQDAYKYDLWAPDTNANTYPGREGITGGVAGNFSTGSPTLEAPVGTTTYPITIAAQLQVNAAQTQTVGSFGISWSNTNFLRLLLFNGRVYAQNQSGSGYLQDSGFTYPIGPTFFCGFTVSSAGKVTIYLNIDSSSANQTGNIGFTPVLNGIGFNFNGGSAERLNGSINWIGFWGRDLTDAEMLDLYANPWQILRNPMPRIWKQGPAGAAVNLIGGGADTLHALTDAGGGSIGLAGGGADTLKALTDSGGGAIGARGGGADTLQALTTSGGGTIQTNFDIGGGAGTLQALSESGGGRIGAAIGGFDILKAITESGAGKIGLQGGGAGTLRALTETGGGTSAATPLQPAAGGFFGRAWWGYEDFSDGKHPWWYKDLKDKARELERQRQIRIDLGILPKDEARQIARTVREVDAFAEEMPTPESAERYIARAEELTERITVMIETLQEQDDEEAILYMSRFFFEHQEHIWKS